MKEQNDIHIFCGFDNSKPTFDKVIYDVFGDYAEKKRNKKNSNNNRQNENITLQWLCVNIFMGRSEMFRLLERDFKVGMYIRLSREDGDKQESESIGNQRQIIKRYITENNLTLIDEYVDDGVSGTTFDRKDFNRMINDIENGKINMVITKDLSRLGRDYIKTGYYIENYFPENQIRYVSILDGIDTYSETVNNDITPFKAILNDMYAKDISKKIRSVYKEKQKQGEFLGAVAAYGYKKDPTNNHKLIIDDRVADIVRKIFDMYVNGTGAKNIVKYLSYYINYPIIYN